MDSINLKPIFSGLVKFTTKDDFGNLSATLFTLGCNFKCKYCYNLEFLEFNQSKLLDNKEIVSFLEKRVGILDSIVICGGEPTIHNENLIEWIKYIKHLGYKVKLDTNGTNPKIIKNIIENNLIDFISLDFKGLKSSFNNITQTTLFDKFDESLNLIINSNIKYEVRTTVHSSLLDKQEIKNMKEYLKNLNCQKWSLQQFLNTKVLDNKIGKDNTNFNELNFKEEIKNFNIKYV